MGKSPYFALRSAFNRTIIELKPLIPVGIKAHIPGTFNRTIIELKLTPAVAMMDIVGTLLIGLS